MIWRQLLYQKKKKKCICCYNCCSHLYLKLNLLITLVGLIAPICLTATVSIYQHCTPMWAVIIFQLELFHENKVTQQRCHTCILSFVSLLLPSMWITKHYTSETLPVKNNNIMKILFFIISIMRTSASLSSYYRLQFISLQSHESMINVFMGVFGQVGSGREIRKRF